MAKAILKFDLTDADDRMDHLRCVKATEMALALWQIVYNHKKEAMRYFDAKCEVEDHGPDYKGPDYNDVIDYVWNQILSELEDNDIFIDKLID